MVAEYTIYGLACVCSPFCVDIGFRYVGQTRISIDRRFQAHKSASSRFTSYPVYRWMNKHGVDNIVAIQIETTTSFDELNQLEKEFIVKFRRLGISVLLNVRDGGWDGRNTTTHCPKGHKYTPENTRIYGELKTCRQCDRERPRRVKDFGVCVCGSVATVKKTTQCLDCYNRERENKVLSYVFGTCECGNPVRYSKYSECQSCYNSRMYLRRKNKVGV